MHFIIFYNILIEITLNLQGFKKGQTHIEKNVNFNGTQQHQMVCQQPFPVSILSTKKSSLSEVLEWKCSLVNMQ